MPENISGEESWNNDLSSNERKSVKRKKGEGSCSEGSALKKKRVIIKEEENEETFPMNVATEIRDGVRYLAPYWAVYRTNAKGRWVGRRLVDVFAQEFLSLNKNYPKVACKLGRIYVNGKQMLDADYVLKNGDSIHHWGHRHEHPFKKTLKDGAWTKEYVCMVEGVFPDEEIECNEPIGVLVITMGIQCVRADGKPARSRFKKLWSDGKRSVLSVKLYTGRTHQIRVHAQFLGYPIVGDQLYNSIVWGPQKGKGAEYCKSYSELCDDIRKAHQSSNWHETVDPDYAVKLEKMANEELKPEPYDYHSLDRPSSDPICLNCNVVKKEIPRDHFQLYLHCLQYSTEKWSYSTPLPEWAIDPTGG